MPTRVKGGTIGVSLHHSVEYDSTSTGHHGVGLIDRMKAFEVVVVPGENDLDPVAGCHGHQLGGNFIPVGNSVEVIVVVPMPPGGVHRVVQTEEFPGLGAGSKIGLEPLQLRTILPHIILARIGPEEDRKMSVSRVEGIVEFGTRPLRLVRQPGSVVGRLTEGRRERLGSTIEIVITPGKKERGGPQQLTIHTQTSRIGLPESKVRVDDICLLYTSPSPRD